ncbi:cytoplasmic tRNA 2-thiolation protein 2-A-like [Anneissia japonica]|uniref:cytoplasmic tRNA 2-thiolation protein 2-A-like n=1 Tax=Anneissia japonica TaxID=1529436 RepID=UPI00142595ED|nr:cytoplasmic tRNA 2-thiolation protein 2-A-like [Anneissia japonica]
MCEVSSSDDSQFMTKKSSISTTGRKCMKCEEKAVLLIRINDAFCRNCFIQYMTHKFRSAIGKGRLILYDEKVLLAYSAGHSSCAMLHLVQQGFLEHVHKKLRFIPYLAHIDEGAVTDQTADQRTARRQEIASRLQNTGIPFDIVSLEKVMSLMDGEYLTEEPIDLISSHNESSSDTKEAQVGDTCSQSSDPATSSVAGCACADDLSNQMASLGINGLAGKLRKLIESTKTLTAKEDLLWRLRNQLLVKVARQRGCSKIMLADSGTLVSVRILANISQGRGAALPLDTGFIDRRLGDIAFIRPLKEFTKKEIVLYNNFHNVQSMFVPSLTTKAGSEASINLLTEEFVNGLQADFPSTVSTICRTGEKLGTDGSLSQDICLLCKASLDTSVPEASALNATNFSLSLSKTCRSKMARSQPSSGNQKQCCGEGDGSCQSNKISKITMEDVESHLCYGCRVTIRDVTDVNLLPTHLTAAVEKTARRSKMKEEIQEFLLPDD